MSWWPSFLGGGKTAEQKRDDYALDNVSARQKVAPLPDNHAHTALGQIQARIRAEEIKSKQLDHKIKKATIAAKEAHTKKDMARAKSLLRQVAIYKKQRAQKDGLIQNLIQQELAMDSAAGTVETAKAMKAGAESMHTLVHQADNDLDVHEIADSMSEAITMTNELADALGQPMGLDLYDDGDGDVDIEDQLAEWDNENEILKGLDRLEVPSGGVVVKPIVPIGTEKQSQQSLNEKGETEKNIVL